MRGYFVFNLEDKCSSLTQGQPCASINICKLKNKKVLVNLVSTSLRKSKVGNDTLVSVSEAMMHPTCLQEYEE